MNKMLSIFGIVFDSLSRREALARMSHLIRSGKKDSESHYVATVNLDFMYNTFDIFTNSIKHPELYQCLNDSDMVVADGMPLVWWSKLLKSPLPERVAGADLLPDLCFLAERQNLKVYFLGGTEEVLEKTYENIKLKNPNLNIVGCSSPFIKTEGEGLEDIDTIDESVIADLQEKKPDILFLCLGCPKQELFYKRLQERVTIPLVIGLGGSPNFVANKIKRAPKFLQENGLEWLYRLSQEPKRLFERYSKNGIFFLWNTVKIILSQKSVSSKNHNWRSHSVLINNNYEIVWTAPDKIMNLSNEIFDSKFCILDFSNVKYVSAEAIAEIHNKLRNKELSIINIGNKLNKKIKLTNDNYLLNNNLNSISEIDFDNKHISYSKYKSELLCHLYGDVKREVVQNLSNTLTSKENSIQNVCISCKYIGLMGHEFIAKLIQLSKVLQENGTALSLIELKKEHIVQLKSMKLEKYFDTKESVDDYQYLVDESQLENIKVAA